MQRRSESPLPTRSTPKTEISPKKAMLKSHTIHNEDKLMVFIKFKPCRSVEQSDQVKYVSEREIEVKTAIKNKMYSFDHVFSGQQDHMRVFDVGCRELIDHVFTETHQKNHANHGLIFVYGNTGTGKTFTMGLLNTIQKESVGIVPDSLRYIFQAKKKKCYEHYQISISFSEIYMDEIYDLLDFESEAKLSIREDVKTKQPFVEHETIIGVETVEQAYQIVNIGLEKRRVAEQKMNRKSSRGHGLITVNLNANNGQKPGRLCFIDLAGCERLKDSESKGLTLNEALHINSSLSSLQTLLMNISDQNVRNYRSSKLTRLLQPYIEYGRINLFVTSTADSVNTIQFAKRCKGIKFMQKELRIMATPKKQPSDRPSKPTKQLEQLLQFRKESIQREKKLISCIASLIGMLNRITGELENSFRGQTVHSKYSFSEIINNAEIEGKINKKIREFENKQEAIVEFNLEKLAHCPRVEISAEEILKLLSNPSELTAELQQQTQQTISSLRSFSVYADYKNAYKQEFFTSELKLHLLENKSKMLEEGMAFLTKHVNTADKRVMRRLKEMGVGPGKENIENLPHLRNRKEPTKSSEKLRGGWKGEETTPFDHSERRSAIYIDEY